MRALRCRRRDPRGLNCALASAHFRAIFRVMPTYEYHCAKCDQNFEAFQSMREEPFSVCPKELCRLPKWGHGKVKRLLGTGAGIIFKGSGFYTTDYRSSAYKEAAKKETPDTAADQSAADKKPDTKPAPGVASKGKSKKE